MTTLFRHRWLTALGASIASAVLTLLLGGQVDLLLPVVVFLLAAIACSYPAFLERAWQSRHLPSDTVHVAAERIRKAAEYDLYALFEIPSIYEQIKSRYALKSGDSGAPGLFLYIYLPSWLYDIRNLGPETVYRRLAARLKEDLQDPADPDLMAQRSLPLALGFRFLPKNAYAYHEMSRWICVVRTQYFRENTWVRGVLQSPKRLFRVHAPEDNEWRTFAPFLEDSRVLAGGVTPAHDFRGNGTRRITLQEADRIGAERVDFTERIQFGALLTYAKKGEIALRDFPEASDKLYIDRVNVLVYGTEHRREILQQLRQSLRRDLTEEDFYPLFNYGQKLRGYIPAGKGASDFVSSRGNFALYYDADRGWTLHKLEAGLVLQIQEAYWGQPPVDVAASRPLSASRATVFSGAPDSLLQFQVSTGTPTRGRILTADAMIEQKVRDFAALHGYRILRPAGGGAEGCLFLAEKNGKRFYLKNPDGKLAQEEIQTIHALQARELIPRSIATFSEDRMVVSPEFPPLHRNGMTAAGLLFRYVRSVLDAGYLCLDLTPDHVRIDSQERRLFLIDFSGYVEAARFRSQATELLADRKKIEYRTPEEALEQVPDPERFQVYLLGLLIYQILREDRNLPPALQALAKDPSAYNGKLPEDLAQLPEAARAALSRMLAFDPMSRPTLPEIADAWNAPEDAIRAFWNGAQS